LLLFKLRFVLPDAYPSGRDEHSSQSSPQPPKMASNL
jgi:hypothetical protein